MKKIELYPGAKKITLTHEAPHTFINYNCDMYPKRKCSYGVMGEYEIESIGKDFVKLIKK